jgi:AraC-like DNA-binding protein
MNTTRVTITINIECVENANEETERENERFAKALKYGIENSASIEELAAMCYQSPSTFKRRFRERYSISPHKWLLEKKLEIALHIIKEQNIAIAELTRLCGFTNTSHFIHLFRTRYGTSPARLAKQLRKVEGLDENFKE